MAAAVLALASEGGADAETLRYDDLRNRGSVRGVDGTPEIEELLASHSALHRAAVAHALHKKAEQSLANGRPIHLPVIPKSPPVCSAPVSPAFCRVSGAYIYACVCLAMHRFRAFIPYTILRILCVFCRGINPR